MSNIGSDKKYSYYYNNYRRNLEKHKNSLKIGCTDIIDITNYNNKITKYKLFKDFEKYPKTISPEDWMPNTNLSSDNFIYPAQE